MNWRELTEHDLRTLYLEEGYSLKQIGDMFDTYPKTIKRLLDTFGIEARPASSAHVRRSRLLCAYFSNWSPRMAYLLGWLMTDGCVHGSYVNLEVKDKEVVEFFAEELSAGRIRKRTDRDIYVWRIKDANLVDVLRPLGVVERKSRTLTEKPFVSQSEESPSL